MCCPLTNTPAYKHWMYIGAVAAVSATARRPLLPRQQPPIHIVAILSDPAPPVREWPHPGLVASRPRTSKNACKTHAIHTRP